MVTPDTPSYASKGWLLIGGAHFVWALAGECIPIRLFLSSIDLTPTYRGVNNRFSVRYYLNLVLVDEEDRRYGTLSKKDVDRSRRKGIRDRSISEGLPCVCAASHM